MVVWRCNIAFNHLELFGKINKKTSFRFWWKQSAKPTKVHWEKKHKTNTLPEIHSSKQAIASYIMHSL